MSSPEAGPDPTPTAGVQVTGGAPRRRVGAWSAALGACLLASALGAAATEAIARRVPTEIEDVDVNGEVKGIVTASSADRSDVKRATMAFGFRGAVLGAALGLAGGLARRKIAAGAGLAGLVLGGAAGGGAAFGAFTAYLRHRDPISGDLLLPLLCHAAAWAALGAAGGLAFGLGLFAERGPAARSALAGLIVAALGAAAFQIAGAFAFPGAKTDMPLASEPAARLAAEALCGLSVAAGTAFAASNGSGRAGAPSQSPA